jgi:hypothetical protein
VLKIRHYAKRQTVSKHCMAEHKYNIKTIIEVLTFGLIFISISTIDNPIVSFIFLGILIAYWTHNLYSKFQYRKGKADYIRFPTQSDQYSKTTSITLGLVIFALSVIVIVWQNSFKYHAVIGITIGLLVFLNGLFDLPKGMMKVHANEISITGLKNKIDIRQLKEIKIYKERMILTNVYDEIQRIDNLAIDTDSAQLIDRYISELKNNNVLSIKNNVC